MSRTINTYANSIGPVEVSDSAYHTAMQLLTSKPILETMGEFKQALEKRLEGLSVVLYEMTTRHHGVLKPKEQVVEKLQRDLAQVQGKIKNSIDRGQYSEVHAQEATEAEITQALLTAEVELAQVLMTCTEERAKYLDQISRGQFGTGAKVEGVEWYDWKAIMLSLVLEWSNSFAQDLTTVSKQEAWTALSNFEGARYSVEQTKKRLEDHKKAQQAKYGGNTANFKPTAQAVADNKKAQVQRKAALAELEKATGHQWTQQIVNNGPRPLEAQFQVVGPDQQAVAEYMQMADELDKEKTRKNTIPPQYQNWGPDGKSQWTPGGNR